MKKIILLLSAILSFSLTLWVGAYHYNSYNNYNSNSYREYSYGWYSHSSYNRVCWFNGHSFKTFNSVYSLRNQRNYIFAYSSSCTSSRNDNHKRDIGYYSNLGSGSWEPKKYYGSTFNPNLKGCPVYTQRALVPQCYYKYTTNNLGCTRPVIHCEGRVTNKFIETSSYWSNNYSRLSTNPYQIILEQPEREVTPIFDIIE